MSDGLVQVTISIEVGGHERAVLGHSVHSVLDAADKVALGKIARAAYEEAVARADDLIRANGFYDRRAAPSPEEAACLVVAAGRDRRMSRTLRFALDALAAAFGAVFGAILAWFYVDWPHPAPTVPRVLGWVFFVGISAAGGFCLRRASA